LTRSQSFAFAMHRRDAPQDEVRFLMASSAATPARLEPWSNDHRSVSLKDRSASHHLLRQPGSQQRKYDQNDQSNDVGYDKRDHALEDGGEGYVLHHALDDKDVHADRWMNEAEFYRHDNNDPEPDRVKSQLRDHRKDDRHGEDDHRHRIHQAAEHEIHHHDQGEHAVAAEAETGEEFGNLLRGLRHREEIAEDQRTDQHREHRCRGP